MQDDDIDVVVGQESVFGRTTTPTTKLDPSVLRDAGIDDDYYPAN